MKYILLAGLFILCLQNVHAKPYIPSDDNQILERLPSGSKSLNSIVLRKLLKEIKSNPEDLKATVNFAKNCIELTRSESDPRYLGYAEAVLKPLIKKNNPEILVLYATIKQSNHSFNEALSILDDALKIDSANEQAWLTKAQIFTTLGKYSEAKQSCIHLLTKSNQLVSIACISSAACLNGSADKSYKLLEQITDTLKNTSISNNEKLWAHVLLAEIAARKGNKINAEKHYKMALSLNPDDNYLLASYSDFLLDENKPEEVINLLKKKTKSDSLFLRLIIAEKKMNSPGVESHTNELKTRFLENSKRGENIHEREEAIFNLAISNNPALALELAQKNWQKQKEPIDARIFLKSAIAANKKNTTKPVIEFINQTMIEDIHLIKLAEEIKGISK